MTIKAILRNGHIQPLEPPQANCTEGLELVVEEPDATTSADQIKQWDEELDIATA